MSEPKRILLFTNSEYGQFNTILATSYELLLRGCEVHIASFSAPMFGLAVPDRITKLNDGSHGALPADHKPAVFHQIPGAAMLEARMAEMVELRKKGKGSELFCGTGIKTAFDYYPNMVLAFYPWEPAQYLEGTQKCVQIIKDVNPDLIVNERLCSQGIDAANHLGRNFVVISPNTFKETLLEVQPRWFGYRKIPADVSGLSYPVPWYQTLPNIYLNTRWFRAFFNCPEIKAITALRHSQGFTGPLPPHGSYDTKKHYLIATAPECDFKFPFIPANVTACGPMILPFPPLHTADPDLESWLKQRPTILFNLGSLYISTEEISVTIASALKIVLERLVDLQVLWKLNMVEGSREKAEEILEKQIKEGRVRIETWLKAEPNALLGSGSVVVSVHHGGANSYFEAVRAGVPHVVLPLWWDCFDFATRAEYLGIGVWGNRKAGIKFGVEELSRSIIEVVDQRAEKGKLIAQKAKKLGFVMGYYRGRETAAEKIMELVEDPKFCRPIEEPKLDGEL